MVAPKNEKNLEELIKQIETLSVNDRAFVLERLSPEKVIIINDWLGQNKQRPCAIIIYSRDEWESIDILASVQNNAIAIGHPAILIAIRRWEQAILNLYPLSRSRKDGDKQEQHNKPETRNSKAGWKAARGEFKWVAEDHLKRIGKALLEAAKSPTRRRSSLTIFKALTQRIDQVDADYLKLIWETLSQDEIHNKSYGVSAVDGREYKKERTYKEKLRILKTRVIDRFVEFGFEEEPIDLSSYKNWPKAMEMMRQTAELCFGPVLDFLSAAECRKFLDKQGDWPEFRNAYTQWRTGYKRNTVKTNRSGASKNIKQINTNTDISFLVPDVEGNNHYYAHDIDNAFLLPTVPCTLRDCPCHKRER
jgi:hypothetical protein